MGYTIPGFACGVGPDPQEMNSRTSGFASTDWREAIGLDSIWIAGDPVPVPDPGSTLLPPGIGVAATFEFASRRRGR